ncbi:ParA family protein [Enterococcus faecalis]|uniref:ParA family protein n=1 Tax=Enterococcus faecalis TaxID=1351 RepID=UPI000F80CF0C|nr:AAA family ATPase [Enterococcus faecalis]EIB6784841.1 AAA family ATPase [Enterococcus faecalis]EKZ0202453.1 AAA family ATPase [Enterococcus faecalis]MCC4085276.1 AAA family ATPase [Enterococcus faecalis]MDG4630489.1 AAA family ATPase [Enterococcus faecalis]MDG4633406.1 AAA family ATPase [Enterococcus faecalis]
MSSNGVAVGSVNIQKGGTGKSSTVFNLGEKISEEKSVLLIDIDESGNLSSRYILNEKYDLGLVKPENKIGNLFTNGSVTPIHIHKNLDLIVSSSNLPEIEKKIQTKPNNRLILVAWIADNYEELAKKYDYILIDTHNDTSIITQNAWVASDVVFAVSDPSMDAFIAVQKLEHDIEVLRQELVEFRSKESYLQAEFKFVGNKIEHNTNSSKEFLELARQHDKFIGYIQKKELINTANIEMTPINEFAKDKNVYLKHKSFFDHTFELYEKMRLIMDNH